MEVSSVVEGEIGTWNWRSESHILILGKWRLEMANDATNQSAANLAKNQDLMVAQSPPRSRSAAMTEDGSATVATDAETATELKLIGSTKGKCARAAEEVCFARKMFARVGMAAASVEIRPAIVASSPVRCGNALFATAGAPMVVTLG